LQCRTAPQGKHAFKDLIQDEPFTLLALPPNFQKPSPGKPPA
jgi:hypothetical protein